MKGLNRLSKRELMKLLSVITLSNGTISKDGKYYKCIKLDTIHYNKCQHDLFDYLCQKVFNKKTKRYKYISNKSKMLSSKLFGKRHIEELLELSPSYQTSTGPNMSKEEFLNSKQPSISSILNDKSKNVKKLALRTYFDFDGSIIPSFKVKDKKDKKGGKVYQYYQVQFECDINIAETNPNLVRELILLCTILKLNASIVKDKRKWSGINGIRISELDSVKKFIKLGGPISDVKISSKSKRLRGVSKKAVCTGVINFLNKNISLSYYFKTYEEALNKKEELNKKLIDIIRK